MNVPASARAGKLLNNTFTPEPDPVEAFAARLKAVGVKVDEVQRATATTALGQRPSEVRMNGVAALVLTPPAQVPPVVKSDSLKESPLVTQRSRLSFIVDALGPNGADILTEDGIKYIRAAERVQEIHDGLSVPPDDMEVLLGQYDALRKVLTGRFKNEIPIDEQTLRIICGDEIVELLKKNATVKEIKGLGEVPVLDLTDPSFEPLVSAVQAVLRRRIEEGTLEREPVKADIVVSSERLGGLTAFDAIVGIVDSQKDRQNGVTKPFDQDRVVRPFDIDVSRDVNMAKTLLEYVHNWVKSGLGDPSLRKEKPVVELDWEDKILAKERFREVEHKDPSYELTEQEIQIAEIRLLAEKQIITEANEVLAQVAIFSDAHEEAFRLKMASDEASRGSRSSFTYSLSEEFPRLTLIRGTTRDGRDFMLHGPDPGIEPGGMTNSGPAAR